MGRFIAFIYVVLGLASAAVVTYSRNPVGLTPVPVQQPAAVATVISTGAAPATFSATGTLVFYPNNVKPVPYIFYQDSNGRTVAKALTFPADPPADFSSWTAAHISVEGTRNQEHVVVSRITYLSGP